MSILIKPLITEKYTKIGEQLNQFSFIVSPKASKDQIKREVEKLYGVTVFGVNTMNFTGKTKTRYFKRNIIEGRKNNFKKAIVTLKSGDKIDFYSNI